MEVDRLVAFGFCALMLGILIGILIGSYMRGQDIRNGRALPKPKE